MKYGHYSRTLSLQIITHEIVDSLNRNPSCFVQWLPFHWNLQVCKLISQHRKAPHCDQEEEENLPLPHDMVVEIFARLPAELVHSCCHSGACRPIHPFITSPSFVDIHLNRATPVIAIQCYTYDQIALKAMKNTYKVSIDFTCGETMMTTATTKRRIKIDLGVASPCRVCMSLLYGSHNGFLLFKNTYTDTVLFIWNPITNENLTLDTGSLCHTPCAFYFHPKSREHRVLVLYELRNGTSLFGFIVVNLETKMSRVITPANFSHPPLLKQNPIILNGILHWPVDGVRYRKINGILPCCSNSIVAFHMDTEEVQTISHPAGYQCHPTATHRHIQIIDMEGKLCYCDYYNPSGYTEISLWILEDYEKQVWVKRHVVKTDPMMNASTIEKNAIRLLFHEDHVEVVNMYGDELLINLFRRNLFLYNLRCGTFRRAGKKSFSSLVRPVAHINSLVSLKKVDDRSD